MSPWHLYTHGPYVPHHVSVVPMVIMVPVLLWSPCPHGHRSARNPMVPTTSPWSPCPPRPQCENNSSMRWQMALYREMAGKAEDSDSPEKIVRRVQEVSAVLYHLEQVWGGWGGLGGAGGAQVGFR